MGLRETADLIVDGNLTVGGTVSLGSTANVQPNAMDHQHVKTYQQSGTAVSATAALHECRGTAGIIKSLRAGSIVACIGAATITIDLQKSSGGGAFATVLSAVITLNSASPPRVSVAGAISSSALAQGDVLQIVITATAGGGTLGTGLWVDLRVDEDYGT